MELLWLVFILFITKFQAIFSEVALDINGIAAHLVFQIR